MSVSAPSSQSEFTADDVYLWLGDSETDKSIVQKDLTTQTKAFLKAKGFSSWKVFRESEKFEPTVKKAVDAFSFVTVANSLRKDPTLAGNPLKDRVSPFGRSKISQIFNTRVAPDRLLLIPGNQDIEFFSGAWDLVATHYPEGASVEAMAAIQKIVDTDDMPIFPKALELFKLERDPRLASIHPSKRQEFIENNYPLLANSFNRPIGAVFNEILQRGERDFLSCMKDCIDDKGVIKGALLIKTAHSTAVINPDRVLADIKLVSDNWDAVQRVFSRVTPQEAETVLKNLGVPPNEMASIRPLVLLGAGLEAARAEGNLDPFNLALLTPLQADVWAKRDSLIDGGIGALQIYIDRMVQHETDLYPIHDRVQPFIDDRNEHNVTKQFAKDGHRYEQIVLTRADGNSTLFPGENTRQASQPVLLARLRELATTGDHLDPVLFATLQESVCQNIEKPATQERIRRELEAAFGLKDLVGFVPIIWGKECIGLEKIDDTHFKATHDYNLVTVHPTTGVRITRRIRLEFPMQPGEAAGSWTIGTPHWSCIPAQAPGLAIAKEAIPLAALAAPQQEPAAAAAADKPVGVVEEEEEIDWDAVNAQMRIAREEQ